MDDVILKLWPYLEKAGTVAAIIVSAGLIWASRQIARRDEIIDKLQARLDAVQEDRIKDAKEITGQVTRIIEQNTAATAANADLLRGLFHRGPQ
jgi:hypothetical protein